MKNDNNKNNNTNQNNKQQSNEVSPYSRGKSMNPTQNPDLNGDDFSKSMKNQDRPNNAGGRTQETHPSNSPGNANS